MTTSASLPGRARLGLLLVILGALLLAHPLYLWPHYGQTQVGMAAEPRSDPSAAVVEYGELPPAARAAFREAVDGERVELWTGEDDAVIETFDRRALVRYRGETYQVVLFFSHPGSFAPVFLRWLLTAASAFAIAYGGLVRHADAWRPLTPRRSLWVSATVIAGFLATAAYDVTLSGADGSVWALSGQGPGLELLLLVPITSLFVPIGSAAATNGFRSPAVDGGAVAVLLLAYVRFLPGVHLVSVVILTVYTAIGGAMWGAIGYKLTPGGD